MIVALLAAASLGAAPSVAIDAPEPIADRAKALVTSEGPALRWVEASAEPDLGFTLDSAAQTLTIREAGQQVEVRRLEAADREVVARLLARLIVDAVVRWRPSPAPSAPGGARVDDVAARAAPPPNPRPRSSALAAVGVEGAPDAPSDAPSPYRVGVGLEVLAWSSPLTPQLGASLFGQRGVGPVWLGARLDVLRWCCGVAADGFDTDLLSVGGHAEAAWAAVGLGSTTVGVLGELGGTWERLRVTPVFPGGTGPRAERAGAALSGRLAVWLGLSWRSVDVRVSAGARMQSAVRSFRLPEPFDADSLESGAVVPYLRVETAFRSAGAARSF